MISLKLFTTKTERHNSPLLYFSKINTSTDPNFVRAISHDQVKHEAKKVLAIFLEFCSKPQIYKKTSSYIFFCTLQKNYLGKYLSCSITKYCKKKILIYSHLFDFLRKKFLKEKNFSAVNNYTTRYIYFQIRSPVSYLFILRLVVWPFFHGKRPFHGDFNFREGRGVQEKNLKHCCSLQAAFRTDYTTDESEGRSKILLLSEASFCESITSV